MTDLSEVPQRADDVIRDLGSFIRARVHRPAAGDLGELDCFRGGMLRSLKRIASGNGEPEDQERLQQQLAATARGLDEIMERLRDARVKLSGQADAIEFSDCLGELVDGSFEKTSILERIGEVIGTDLKSSGLPALAQAVCKEIDVFNRLVIELARLAKKSDAHPLRSVVERYQNCSLEALYEFLGNDADRFLTDADRQRYVLGIPDPSERGKRIVDEFGRGICAPPKRAELEVLAELSGGPVLEPIAWLLAISRFTFEAGILSGLSIDDKDAVAMALGRRCGWNLDKLCDW